MDYLDLTIVHVYDERGDGDGSYRVSLRAPGGKQTPHLALRDPPDTKECEAVIAALDEIRRSPSAFEHQDNVCKVEKFGKRLYQWVFQGALLEMLGGYLNRGEDFGIRLGLSEAGNLARAPWEFLRHPQHDQFLALRTSPRIVLTRYLGSSLARPASRLQGALRMLVVLPQYSGDNQLDSEREWVVLQRALRAVEPVVRIDATRLAPPVTWDKLYEALTGGSFHILHFGGHAQHDPARGKGSLWLEGSSGGLEEIDCEALADLLDAQHVLRLVMLNACEGGRLAAAGFAGLASGLCQRGFPAVVAMQFPVTDDFAIAFTACLYKGLIEGRPVADAVHSARQAMRLKEARDDLQWATPVVYQGGDGVLFPRNDRPRDVGRSISHSNGEKNVERFYCDRDQESQTVVEAIPEYPRATGTGRPVVLVAHGDTLAEHWAFLKRIELKILPLLGWTGICAKTLPELSPGQGADGLIKHVRLYLASKFGTTGTNLESVIAHRFATSDTTSDSVFWQRGGQALLIDLQCRAAAWRGKEESLLRDLHRCWSEFKVKDLPAEMLLICVLSVRYEPIPRGRRKSGPDATMLKMIQESSNWWPEDHSVGWTVLPQFDLVDGYQVQTWDKEHLHLNLPCEEIAIRAFPVRIEDLEERRRRGPSALASYVESLKTEMQPLLLRLDELLEEKLLKQQQAQPGGFWT